MLTAGLKSMCIILIYHGMWLARKPWVLAERWSTSTPARAAGLLAEPERHEYKLLF